MFKDPPRVIIALARHRNEVSYPEDSSPVTDTDMVMQPDHWAAHRFDLTNGHMRSYSVTHDEKPLKDGRPFMCKFLETLCNVIIS